MASSQTDTPLMQQWREIKARHPDSLVFFRVGDFYEMFFEDAETGAKLLDITLTSRNNGSSKAPLAGIPVHALDGYLQKLVRLGRRVAICEQVEDPAQAKGLVRREVVETISPGTALADGLLDVRRNNFLVAVAGDPSAGGRIAIATADLSTGELRVQTIPADAMADTFGQIEPAELVAPRSWELLLEGTPDFPPITYRPDWFFEVAPARELVQRHFGVHSLDGFGIPQDDAIACALGAAVGYLNETQPRVAAVLSPPRFRPEGAAMPIDEMTRRNLELVESLAGGAGGRTLLDVVDRTLTPMGARLLRQWILAPLLDPAAIRLRLDVVEEMKEGSEVRREVRRQLREIRDLERLAVKIAAGRCSPRDLIALATSVGAVPGLLDEMSDDRAPLLTRMLGEVDLLADLVELVSASISPDTPVALADGGVICSGFNEELDELRATREGAVDWIARLQAEERSRTGINSLKVGYNRVFGYYLEVSRAAADRVPSHFQRRQTLANAERYVTPELKEWEEKVLGADEKIVVLETAIFEEIRTTAASFTPRIQRLAAQVAQIDVLTGLAELAVRSDYVKPTISEEYGLTIRSGRHPVVETMMPREEFIPNDVRLDDEQRVIVLTGPNMAGKSTVLRQIGLIVLLAQIGSFVPAAEATVGVADRIFTRVGASDNLVRGRSTFMVEMTETGAILNAATGKSLILLDEIGRGTSTWDGLSVATAVTEYIHDRIGARTMFATHYHELTELSERLEGAVNYSVAVKEEGDSIIFIRSLIQGGSDRSYGVEVARLAGLPAEVIERARSLLNELEQRGRDGGRARQAPSAPDTSQLGLFPARENPIVERIRALDPNQLTPIQALALLAELKDQAGSQPE